MKRYLLFAWDGPEDGAYPMGGPHDLLGDFDELADARRHLDAGRRFDEAAVLDTETSDVIDFANSPPCSVHSVAASRRPGFGPAADRAPLPGTVDVTPAMAARLAEMATHSHSEPKATHECHHCGLGIAQVGHQWEHVKPAVPSQPGLCFSDSASASSPLPSNRRTPP